MKTILFYALNSTFLILAAMGAITAIYEFIFGRTTGRHKCTGLIHDFRRHRS